MRDLPPWGWRECAVALGLAVASLALIIGVASAVVVASGDRNANSVPNLAIGLAATFAFEGVLFGVATIMTVGRFPGGLALLGFRLASVPAWLRWACGAFALAWAALIGYELITAIPGLHALQPKGNVPPGIFDHRQTIPAAVFLTVVAAPLVEETFFRGFLFNGLRRKLGFSAAAATSGVLFALAHSAGTLIIPYTVIAVIFAYAYLRSGTLWATITAHCLFNLVGVVFALAGKGGS